MSKIFCIVSIEIAEGQVAAFRQYAQACVAAASQDLTGTAAYEWFIAEDGCSATVIEAYDNVEAVMLHAKLAGPSVAKVLEVSRFQLEFIGDVPPAIIERMQARLGATTYFGERFQGRLDAPAAGKLGGNAGRMLFGLVRVAIAEGHAGEFRKLAAGALARVVADEPGTIAYEWFISPDEREALILDVYYDEAALAAHDVKATMAKLREISTIKTQLFGALPDSARARFAGRTDIKFAAPQFAGIM